MDTQDIRDMLDSEEEKQDINEDEESTDESSSNDDDESGKEEEKDEDAGGSGPGQVPHKLPQDVGSTRLAAEVSEPRKLTESNDEAGNEEEKEEDAGGSGPKEGNNNCSSLLSWKNETLYPPTKRRKISNPSPVWKFGGFKKGDEQINIITCGLCGKTFEYKNNSPGNFSNHLKSAHEEEWKKQDEVIKSTQPKMTDFTSKTQVKKYSSDHPKQRRFRRKLVEWVIDSLRPFIIAEDRKFVEVIEIADDKLHVVSANTLASDVNKLYQEYFDKTVEGFKNVSFVTCTTDGGSSQAGRCYINVNVHWIDETTFEMKRKLIQVIRAVSKKAVDYRKVVDDALLEHGLLPKCFIFVTDNENTMAATFDGYEERNGCFAHIESKCSQKALDSSEKLKETRARLRRLAQRSNKSDRFKTFIEQEQLAAGLKPRSIKQEVETRFTATHTMFRSILNDPNERSDEDINMEKVGANINAINTALKRVLDPKKPDQYEEQCVRPEDLDRMIKLIPTLDVLEEGITLLGADLYNTGSSVLPFVVNFKHILEDTDEDVGYIRKFKEVLWREMEERVRNNLNFHILIKASFFDKR